MTETAPTPIEALEASLQATSRALTTHDRCDRCGHPALVLTSLNGSELLWCGHHFHTEYPVLLAAGATVEADVREWKAESEPTWGKRN